MKGPVCQAVVSAARGGGSPCRQPATVDADNDGINDSCYVHAHQVQVRERASKPATAPQSPAAVPPAGEVEAFGDAELRALLEQLPPVPDDPAIEVARTVTENPIETPPLKELEDSADREFGQIADDVFTADRAGQEREDRAQRPPREPEPLRYEPTAQEKFSASRIRRYLKLIINPRFKADGKEPLSDDELDEGSEAISMALTDLFGPVVITNPYLRSLAWGVTVVGVRYWEAIVDRLVKLLFPSRPAKATTPAAPEASSSAAPGDVPLRRDVTGVASTSWSNPQ